MTSHEQMNDNTLTATMQAFAGELYGLFGDKLLSVVLFGSAVLGDFTPGKGDLDFLVALQEDLTDTDCADLFALHDRLRAGELGALAAQLEGTYYPPAIIRDPRQARARGCYVGTGRAGWRSITTCQNSLMDFAIIRRHGVICAGQDIGPHIYQPTREELLEEITRTLTAHQAQPITGIEHALALFHWGSRALCYAHTGQLLSKTQAATWYATTFPKDHYATLVLHTRPFRHPLTPAEREQINPTLTGALPGFLAHLAELR